MWPGEVRASPFGTGAARELSVTPYPFNWRNTVELTRSVRRLALAILAGSAIWLGACSDSPTGPGIQPQVLNQPGTFEYQVSDVQEFTGTLSYTWQNTGTTANVNQSTNLSSGSITLRIYDAALNQVYSRSLAENGTFATAAGQPGAWRVQVVYSASVAPAVNFRAETP
jgi:hypothetical protein